MEIKVQRDDRLGGWSVLVICNSQTELQYHRRNKQGAVDCAFNLAATYSFREPQLTFDLRG